MGIAVAGRIKAGDRTDEQKPERAHQRTDRQLVFFGARLARNLVGILTIRKFGIVPKSRFVELPVSQAEYFLVSCSQQGLRAIRNDGFAVGAGVTACSPQGCAQCLSHPGDARKPSTGSLPPSVPEPILLLFCTHSPVSGALFFCLL